ncbi:MAG: hypothetical protein ACHQK9_01045 [Reyranellales bacterium]
MQIVPWGYLVLLAGVAGCALAIVREARHRPMRPTLLLVAPLLALAIAAVVVLSGPAEMRRLAFWGMSFAVAAMAGAVRGFVVRLQVDQMWLLICLPHSRDALWIVIALALLVIGIIVTAVAGAPATAYRPLLAMALIFCAGLLVGRNWALAMRIRRAPHVELRRL